MTLPATVRGHLHIHEGDDVEFTLGSDGRVLLTGLVTVPCDQAWFWTDEWQEGEREASEQIARGDVTVHANEDELFATLDRRSQS